MCNVFLQCQVGGPLVNIYIYIYTHIRNCKLVIGGLNFQAKKKTHSLNNINVNMVSILKRNNLQPYSF